MYGEQQTHIPCVLTARTATLPAPTICTVKDSDLLQPHAQVKQESQYSAVDSMMIGLITGQLLMNVGSPAPCNAGAQVVWPSIVAQPSTAAVQTAFACDILLCIWPLSWV